MSSVGIKGYAYCLNHAPELGLHYGNTPYVERHHHKGESEFLKALPNHMQSFEDARDFAPNQAYIGGITLEEFEAKQQPWIENRLTGSSRYGKFGEIMPEDEFLGLIDICDVFDIIWLEKDFAASIKEKLGLDPVINEHVLARLEAGHDLSEIENEVEKHSALPLYFNNKVVGCARSGHEVDECLFPYVLLENIACKAGGVLSLLHLLKNTGVAPEDIDFVIECSEEAAGDMNQRGGGNFAKAIAEIAGCANASGCDVRGFCAGPVNAMLAAASQVASGLRKNCVVVAGGAIPKLYMNGRDHVKKGMPALEDCLGNFAVLLVPDDGTNPVMRLDAVGKHSVGSGASPQAVTSALVYEPLQQLGISFADVDKYAAELHIPEITLPAGAGDVPLASIKMIAALAVMKKAIEKADMMDFVNEKGLKGYAHTQGHIPSGVPFVGPACEAIKAGTMKRAMIIGKGSLFLARLTNLADGASFFIEPSSGGAGAAVSKEDVKALILEVLSEITEKLQ
ncbi:MULTISPECIES: glycine/sarcosine/betaine reductase complex component C subunit beta [Aminobacterium]|jgi:betaine reductase|uniref:glycine/sarcosine/betaine reductase complex component C subunit beta n=1 Tax=Aminobacterium TaxID=81466 RepID=UPI00257D5442|nr:glycine/sarcosine/betaine reductase complex component C subunit beta [Aminobacterium sp. UBA4987]